MTKPGSRLYHATPPIPPPIRESVHAYVKCPKLLLFDTYSPQTGSPSPLSRYGRFLAKSCATIRYLLVEELFSTPWELGRKRDTPRALGQDGRRAVWPRRRSIVGAQRIQRRRRRLKNAPGQKPTPGAFIKLTLGAFIKPTPGAVIKLIASVLVSDFISDLVSDLVSAVLSRAKLAKWRLLRAALALHMALAVLGVAERRQAIKRQVLCDEPPGAEPVLLVGHGVAGRGEGSAGRQDDCYGQSPELHGACLVCA